MLKLLLSVSFLLNLSCEGTKLQQSHDGSNLRNFELGGQSNDLCSHVTFEIGLGYVRLEAVFGTFDFFPVATLMDHSGVEYSAEYTDVTWDTYPTTAVYEFSVMASSVYTIEVPPFDTCWYCDDFESQALSCMQNRFVEASHDQQI